MELRKWPQGCRVWHPSFVLSLAPAQVEQADTAVDCTLLISPPSAPLSICHPHWAPGEPGHGQRSAALHVNQAGVGWAVIWAPFSLSAAGMLL